MSAMISKLLAGSIALFSTFLPLARATVTPYPPYPGAAPSLALGDSRRPACVCTSSPDLQPISMDGSCQFRYDRKGSGDDYLARQRAERGYVFHKAVSI